MKTQNRSILVLFLFLCLQVVNGQENFKPGYVVSLKNDTTRGEIDYQGWDRSPKTINFRNDQGRLLTYSPRQLAAFEVAGEKYLSKEVAVETSPRLTDELTFDPKIKTITDSVFVRVLFAGSKCLYHYKHHNGNDQFYTANDQKLDLLIYKRYIKEVNNDDFATENKTFVGQLILYLNDCPSIQSEINKVEYNVISMLDLFESYYNKCVEKPAQYVQKAERVKQKVGFVVGATLTSVKFEGSYFDYLTKIDFPASVNATGGLYYNVSIPRSLNRWSFQNELILTGYSISGDYSWQGLTEKGHIYTDLSLWYATLNNLIRYTFPVGKMELFLNGGISNGFAFREVNQLTKSVERFGYTWVTTDEAIKGIRKIEFGFTAGAGASYGRFSAECRYVKGNGVSDYSKMSENTHRIMFLFSYRFY